MKRIPILPALAVFAVILFAGFYFGWSQKVEMARLRHDVDTQRLAWESDRVRLEREVEAAENQSIFFSSKLVEMEQGLRRDAESKPPYPVSPDCVLQHQRLETRVSGLTSAWEKRLEAVSSGCAKRSADIASLQELLAKLITDFAAFQKQSAARSADLEALRKELRERSGKTAADLAALQETVTEEIGKQSVYLAALQEQSGKSAADIGALEKSVKEQLGKQAADLAVLQAQSGKSATDLGALQKIVTEQSGKQSGDLTDLKEQSAKLVADLATLQGLVAKQAEQAGNAQSEETASLKKALADATAALTKRGEEVATLRALLEKQSAEAAAASKKSGEEVAALKAAVEKQGTGASAERQALVQDLEKVRIDVGELRKESAATREGQSREIAGLKGRLDELLASRTGREESSLVGNGNDSFSEGGVAPAGTSVEVTVQAVSTEKGLVVVGGGSDAGVRKGQIMDVLREGRRVGQIRIVKVTGNMAGAKILSVTPGGDIRENDIARVMVSNAGTTKPPVPKPEDLPDPSKVPPPPPPAGEDVSAKVPPPPPKAEGSPAPEAPQTETPPPAPEK